MRVLKFCTALMLAAACSAGFAQTASLGPTAAVGSVVPASEQPSRDDVLKMLDVMHVHKQMEQLMLMMTAQMKQQLHQTFQKNTPGMSADDEAKMEANVGDAMNIYPVTEMLDDMVPVYQRHMTKSDVEAIVAFYGSPAGQHLLEQSPAMMEEAMTTIMPKINARTQALIEKMSMQTAPLVSPPPPPPPPPPQK